MVFNGFYWVLPGFTHFYWVLLVCISFFLYFIGFLVYKWI